MKKNVIFVSAIICVIALGGCGHEHVYMDATCTSPRTCAECGEVEGDALGHIYLGATCELPETCERCGETQGNALGHIYSEATCELPETCERCGETQGNALGHIYSEATCELPSICERCNAVNQEAFGHTTEVGKCDRCNMYQGKDLVNEIFEKINYADSIVNVAFTLQMSGAESETLLSPSSYYEDLQNGLSYYESAGSEYEAALLLCGDYSELSALREDIQKEIDLLPLNLSGKDYNSMASYVNDLKIFFAQQTKCHITMKAIEKEMNM